MSTPHRSLDSCPTRAARPPRVPRPWKPGLVVLAALLAGALWVPPEAEAAGLSQRQLQVEGRILYVVPANLDDDPRRDLVVFHISGQGRRAVRRASVFRHRVGGQFSAVPDITWTLDPGVVAVDIYEPPVVPPRSPEGTRDGQASAPRAQLFSLRPDGVYRHEFTGHRTPPRARRVATAALGHLQPAPDDLVLFDFAADFDPTTGVPGTPEFLLPTVPNFTLLRQAPNAGDELARIEVPVRPQASYGTRSLWDAPAASVIGRLSLPLPTAADQNGDGGSDLIFLRHERLIVVHLDQVDAQGRAAADVFEVDILDPEAADEAPFTVLHRLVDLQGDGRVDLVAAVFRDAGLFEPEGRIMVFRGRADGTFAAQADQQLAVDSGQYFLTLIEDLTGNGRREILMPAAKIGVFGLIKLLTGRKLSFTFVSFDPKADGAYDTGRDTRTSLRALISERNDVSVVFFADVDGDSVLDLLIGSQDDAVCVHQGSVENGRWEFPSRPSECIPESPFATFLHADLDGDGREDLMSYGVRGKASKTLTVTFVR